VVATRIISLAASSWTTRKTSIKFWISTQEILPKREYSMSGSIFLNLRHCWISSMFMIALCDKSLSPRNSPKPKISKKNYLIWIQIHPILWATTMKVLREMKLKHRRQPSAWLAQSPLNSQRIFYLERRFNIIHWLLTKKLRRHHYLLISKRRLIKLPLKKKRATPTKTRANN